MSTIMKDVMIPKSGRIRIELDLPAGFPRGVAVMTLQSKPANEPLNRAAEICGKAKGKVWMADDFDEPVEDFAEYIQENLTLLTRDSKIHQYDVPHTW